MKASDFLVKALESEGVEYIFGIPGEENLDLLESLSKSPIELVLTRHEQAAGFMAATYGRLTGKPGVCLSTLGPGATNLVTAAAYANLGAMPMVMITGQKPVKTNRQGRFQIVDIVHMMKPLTKYTRQVESGARIPFDVREAFRLAQEERPGATHLELPEDIAQESTEIKVIPASRSRRPIAEDKAIRWAAEQILAAKHPLMLVGGGANRTQTCRMLRRLVEQTKIPFITTQMGKGVLAEDDERFLGNAALSSDDFPHRAIELADLIINIGHDSVEKPPFVMSPEGPEVIHVNFSPAAVDPVYFPQVEVVGDIANAIYRLTEELAGKGEWQFDVFDSVRAGLREHLRKGADDDRFPVYPQRMVADLRGVMPRDGLIALDNGIYKIWFARNYAAYSPNTVLLDNALATMGAGLPSAMAAKIVHPERDVIAICGDGGFMMNSAELETAKRLGLDLVVLILRDDALGMIKVKQEAMGFSDYGLDFGNPDFVAYAESYGATGHRVESAAGFAPTVKKAFADGGLHVIELAVDYSENDRILNEELKAVSQAV